MFRKVHRRLTLLCAGITIFILLIMSFLYLYVSETGLKKSQFYSFQRDMSSFVANFEQQSVITHEWLSKIENGNSYIINIMDNHVPFQFNNREPDEAKKQLMVEAFSYYQEHSEIQQASSEYASYHSEFEFSSVQGSAYYGCVAVIPYETSETQILVLSPLTDQHRQIIEQRILFLLINTVAILILFFFSWFFTKKLLLPIEKNRQEQIQFVSSASHELRTPLAVILSCSDAYKKASPGEKEGFLSVIHSEGVRMSRLIDDMLLLSRADNHHFDICPEPAEPDTLLLNSYEAFEPMAKEKKLSLTISLPEERIPPCLLDTARFEQVIAILLHNAISYTPEGGSIRLSLCYQSFHPNTISILVADTGPGIPDEEKESIFKRFYRLEESHNSKEHFGLGLCIAAEIISSFKGVIRVSDTSGGGATFTVIIPVQHPAPS